MKLHTLYPIQSCYIELKCFVETRAPKPNHSLSYDSNIIKFVLCYLVLVVQTFSALCVYLNNSIFI